MSEQRLTKEDVSRLLEKPGDEVRIDTAQKVCRVYNSETLGEQQRAIAEEVFRLLVRDQSDAVRESIAENLKASDKLPHDVALKLAQDIDDKVALPVLECSQILSDDDLVEIVQTVAPARMQAIAGRASVSQAVSGELVNRGDEAVVVKLMSNEGADIATESFEHAYSRFTGSERFDDAVVARDRIPVSVRSKILSALTDGFLEVLSGSKLVSPSIIADIVVQTHDKLAMELSDRTTESRVGELVSSLYVRDLLTAPILLRALCQGDILFFELSMGTLASVPLKNARSLIYDAGGEGFNAIYRKAGLDPSYRELFRFAFKMCCELSDSGEDFEQAVFRRKLIERLLTEGTEIVEKIGKADLDYLLGKL
ncbi:MAG: DUF2336 domain-containing protein [Cyanothece sp. SIO1E1]|nr:DUF2336 domain-containing protein [Cyanothece sp. SIO1E1]